MFLESLKSGKLYENATKAQNEHRGKQTIDHIISEFLHKFLHKLRNYRSKTLKFCATNKTIKEVK